MRKLLFFHTGLSQDGRKKHQLIWGWIPQGSPGPFRERATLVPAAGRPHRSPAPRRGCGRRGSRGGCCLESAGKHGILLGQSMGTHGNIWKKIGKNIEKHEEKWKNMRNHGKHVGKYGKHVGAYGKMLETYGHGSKLEKNISFKITIPLEPLHFRHWFQLVLFACRMIWASHTCQNYISSILQAIHLIFCLYTYSKPCAPQISFFAAWWVCHCLSEHEVYHPPPPKEQLNGKLDDQPMDRIW